jgi:carbon storage regulator CsrA
VGQWHSIAATDRVFAPVSGCGYSYIQGGESMKNGTLILQRAPGERIFIGPDIIIEVHSIQAKRVRFAIIAPKSTRIIREELEPDER